MDGKIARLRGKKTFIGKLSTASTCFTNRCGMPPSCGMFGFNCQSWDVWAHILQQVRDYEADEKADLKTVVVFLGKKRSNYIADILVFISIALFIIACIYGPLNIGILIVSLVSIPFILPLFYFYKA